MFNMMQIQNRRLSAFFSQNFMQRARLKITQELLGASLQEWATQLEMKEIQLPCRG